jgi:hypothetical protein
MITAISSQHKFNNTIILLNLNIFSIRVVIISGLCARQKI